MHLASAASKNSPDFSKLNELSSRLKTKLNGVVTFAKKHSLVLVRAIGAVGLQLMRVVFVIELYVRAIKESLTKFIQNPAESKIWKMMKRSKKAASNKETEAMAEISDEIKTATDKLSKLEGQVDELDAEVKALIGEKEAEKMETSSATQGAMVTTSAMQNQSVANIKTIITSFNIFSAFVTAFVLTVASWLAPLLRTMAGA